MKTATCAFSSLSFFHSQPGACLKGRGGGYYSPSALYLLRGLPMSSRDIRMYVDMYVVSMPICTNLCMPIYLFAGVRISMDTHLGPRELDTYEEGKTIPSLPFGIPTIYTTLRLAWVHGTCLQLACLFPSSSSLLFSSLPLLPSLFHLIPRITTLNTYARTSTRLPSISVYVYIHLPLSLSSLVSHPRPCPLLLCPSFPSFSLSLPLSLASCVWVRDFFFRADLRRSVPRFEAEGLDTRR